MVYTLCGYLACDHESSPLLDGVRALEGPEYSREIGERSELFNCEDNNNKLFYYCTHKINAGRCAIYL